MPRKSLTGDISECVDTRVLPVIYQIKEKEGTDIRDKIDLRGPAAGRPRRRVEHYSAEEAGNQPALT
jgi:hypothetical protein